jgi:type I restriction enzyme S subunit
MNKNKEFYLLAFYNNISTYIEIINNYLSKEFPFSPLSEYIEIIGGYAFKSNHYVDEGIPIVRISDFNNETIDLSNIKKYKESKEFERYELKPGDIIIAMTGGTIGKLAIVQEGLGKLYLNQRVGKFHIKDKDKFYPEYIYWIAKGVQEKIKKIGYGGAQPNVSSKQIEALEFPFPDKETQKKIVSFLNDLKNNSLSDETYFNRNIEEKIKRLQNVSIDLIILNHRFSNLSDYLNKLRQSILQEAVQGKLVPQDPNDEPASVLLEKIKEEKERLIKEGKIKKEKPLPPITEDEIPYELPKGWEWVRLGELCSYIQRGKSPKYSNIEEIPVISQKCIQWDGFDISKARFIDPMSLDSYTEERFIVPFDLLWNSTGLGTLGRINVYPKIELYNKVVADSHVTVIRPLKEFVCSKYLYLWFAGPIVQSEINNKSTGSTKQTELNITTVREYIVPLPPLNEQKRIVEKVDQLMALCDELEKNIEQSKKDSELLMQSVLQEAFKGA